MLRVLGCAVFAMLLVGCAGGEESPGPGPTQTPSATLTASPAPTVAVTSTAVLPDPSLPKPDTTRALPLDEGIAELGSVPGLDAVLTAVEAGDVPALVGMFDLVTLDCEALGRAAGPDCAATNGAIDGKFRAATIEDGGYRWTLAEGRLTALLEAIMAAGTPRPVMATHDRTTPDGEGGVYYLAFEVPAFDASDPVFNYAEGVVGTGFGLQIVAGSETAVVLEFSLLSADWNPLKWTQRDGAPNHELLFPEDLSQYPALYEE